MDISQNPNMLTDLYDIFNIHDPQGLIKLGCPPDEYDSEINTIMKRLNEIKDIESAKMVIYEEFCRWFGEDISGTPDAYDKLATALYAYLRDEGLLG